MPKHVGNRCDVIFNTAVQLVLHLQLTSIFIAFTDFKQVID